MINNLVLRLSSSSYQLIGSKPVKCIQGPIVYASNNSWHIHNNYLLQKLHKCASANSMAMLEALLYFKGSSFIFAPNLRLGKHFFCVLVCCTGSAVYLAGRHLKKIGLELKILHSKVHFLRLKQVNIIKSIHKAPDIFKCRKKKLSNLAQRVFERCG